MVVWTRESGRLERRSGRRTTVGLVLRYASTGSGRLLPKKSHGCSAGDPRRKSSASPPDSSVSVETRGGLEILPASSAGVLRATPASGPSRSPRSGSAGMRGNSHHKNAHPSKPSLALHSTPSLPPTAPSEMAKKHTPITRVCGVSGCAAKHIARGLCFKHYQRWRRTGSPTTCPACKQELPKNKK